HQFRENEFIWIYELVRLRSTKDDRIIPTGTLEDVYLNHEVGPTYIEIEAAPAKRLIPWVETPKADSWEAPEGSTLTREEMVEHCVSAAVAGQSLEPELKEYHAEVEVLGAITVVIPVQA